MKRRPTTVRQHVVYGNVGRGPVDARYDALRDLRAACTDETAVVLNEITADERAWVTELWPKWTVVGPGQTIVLVPPGVDQLGKWVDRIFRAIPRYGSTRHAVRVRNRVGRAPSCSVVGFHFPADFGHWRAEYREGQRVGWATLSRMMRGRRAVAAGDHNVEHGHDLPRGPWTQVERDGLDGFFASAPRGWTVEIVGHRVIPFRVEPQHDGHEFTAVWRRKARGVKAGERAEVAA